jgi:hypothetical protein
MNKPKKTAMKKHKKAKARVKKAKNVLLANKKTK